MGILGRFVIWQPLKNVFFDNLLIIYLEERLDSVRSMRVIKKNPLVLTPHLAHATQWNKSQQLKNYST